MERNDIRFDPAKLEELIIWIANKAPDIGLTKLEKLLYLCDFTAAEKTGKPITGETYRNFDRGPVPKHIMPILSGMDGKTLTRKEIPLSRRDGKFIKLKPLRKCDERKFSGQQKQIIEAVLNKFGSWDSKQLVDYVHEEITYLATSRNEDIPYSLASYRRYEKPKKDKAESLKNDPDYLNRLKEALA